MQARVILRMVVATMLTTAIGAAHHDSWGSERAARVWARAERAAERALQKSESKWLRAERRMERELRRMDAQHRRTLIRVERDVRKAERKALRARDKTWDKYYRR